MTSLAETGGKIVCSLASLRTWGPGRLHLRDKNDLYGIESEKKLFQIEHPGFRQIAGKMVESGIGIDFFLGASGGKYIDVATISMYILQKMICSLLTPSKVTHLLSLAEKRSSIPASLPNETPYNWD